MSEPAFAESAIGAFVAAQPDASRFVVLKLTRGGADSEAAMHALFHAEVIAECLRRGGREPAAADFARLDAVATAEPLAALEACAPALAAYLEENAAEAARDVVAHVALALLR